MVAAISSRPQAVAPAGDRTGRYCRGRSAHRGRHSGNRAKEADAANSSLQSAPHPERSGVPAGRRRTSRSRRPRHGHIVKQAFTILSRGRAMSRGWQEGRALTTCRGERRWLEALIASLHTSCDWHTWQVCGPEMQRTVRGDNSLVHPQEGRRSSRPLLASTRGR